MEPVHTLHIIPTPNPTAPKPQETQRNGLLGILAALNCPTPGSTTPVFGSLPVRMLAGWTEALAALPCGATQTEADLDNRNRFTNAPTGNHAIFGGGIGILRHHLNQRQHGPTEIVAIIGAGLFATATSQRLRARLRLRCRQRTLVAAEHAGSIAAVIGAFLSD